MVQLYLIVNKTKKEYLSPHDFGDRAQFRRFSNSGGGTLLALSLLLRKSSNDHLGGCDDYSGDHSNPLLGSWAGDSISIEGDYDTEGLYHTALDSYENISIPTILLMADDPFIKSELRPRLAWYIATLPIQQRKVLEKALGLTQ